MKTRPVLVAAIFLIIALPTTFARPIGKETDQPSVQVHSPSVRFEPTGLDASPWTDVRGPEFGREPILPFVQRKAPTFDAKAPRDTLASIYDALRVDWSHTIKSGETLDRVLAKADIAASERAEISLALGAEYDLRRLRPGHEVIVTSIPEGNPRKVALRVDDGVRIEILIDDPTSVRVVSPTPDIVPRAGKTVIETSIFAALEEAEMPARFSVDLAQMLGGIIDFRRDLKGGETLRLLWREARVGTDIVGSPTLSFAALETAEALYEVVWPDDETGEATIHLDGELLRVFAQPVKGARISSVFGRRRHPVYGDVRMHTGVDFAAAHGTTVKATAPGRIVFAGWRAGYGRTVDIAHGSGTKTRYAHLSTILEGVVKGHHVSAGEPIGEVGSSGTATGPNLHYEVHVNGRATDPLSEERLALLAGHEALVAEALLRLGEFRALAKASLPTSPTHDGGSDS